MEKWVSDPKLLNGGSKSYQKNERIEIKEPARSTNSLTGFLQTWNPITSLAEL